MLRITVKHRALRQRLDRALGKRGQRLIAPRGRSTNGWALLDVSTAQIVRLDVNLATLANECGVLSPWERIAGEDDR